MSEIVLFQEVEIQNLTKVATDSRSVATTINGQFDTLRAQMAQVDVSELEDAKIVELDSKLNEWINYIASNQKVVEDSRKPFTQKFDEIKKAFTSIENDYKSKIDEVNGYRSNFAIELNNRNKEREAEKMKTLAKSNEANKIAENFGLFMQRTAIDKITNFTKQLTEAFFKKTLEEISEPNLGQIIDQLPNPDATPIFADFVFSADLHNPDEVKAITLSVYEAKKDGYLRWYNEQVMIEKLRLINAIPSRIEELKQGDAPTDRLETELEKSEARAEIRTIEAVAEVQQESATNAMSSALIIESTSEKTQIKGSSTKEEYVVENGVGMAALVTWYFKNIAATLPIDELKKKFGFIVTQANIDLNSKNGTRIESQGLSIKEVVKVRKTSFK